MPLNFFNSRKSRFTALDFSHNSLNLVHCGVGTDEIVLYDWRKQRIPAGVINDGIVDNNSILKVAVNNMLQELSYKVGEFIISPAPGQEFIHRMQISDVAEEDIKTVIHNKLEANLSLSPEDVYCDHLVLQEKDDTRAILLLAIPTGVMDGYKKLFKDNSFFPQVANFQSLALVSLLNYQNKLADVSLIINMDTVKTRITIAAEDDFFLDRITELGGDELAWITKDKKKGWNEQDKSRMRSALSTDEIKADSEAEKIAAKIKEEIEKAIAEQKNNFPDRQVANIFLTGGGFKLQGLRDYFADRLNYDIAVIDPLEGIKLEMDESSQEQKRIYIEDKNMMARALGLIASEVLHDER